MGLLGGNSRFPNMAEYLDFSVDLSDPLWASAVDELSLWAARFGLLLLRHVPIQPGRHVLDVACGTGFPLLELAGALGPSSRLTGVDIWWPGLRRATLKRQVYRLDNAALACADGVHLPFSTGCFDLIVSNLGINNFALPGVVLAECARVTKPGGRICLTTNVVGHMAEFYQLFRELLAGFDRPDYFERLAANEAHRLDRTAITGLLEPAAYEVVKTVEESFVMRYQDGSAFFRHPLSWLGFLDGWRQVVDPADEPHLFDRLEAQLNKLAQVKGELRLTVPMLYLEAVRTESSAGPS
jgi:SAM-dependent methyltransferase